jgi:hypothetical protein
MTGRLPARIGLLEWLGDTFLREELESALQPFAPQESDDPEQAAIRREAAAATLRALLEAGDPRQQDGG